MHDQWPHRWSEAGPEQWYVRDCRLLARAARFRTPRGGFDADNADGDGKDAAAVAGRADNAMHRRCVGVYLR